jgi:hypothetical protein
MASSLSSRALMFITLVVALLGCAFAHRGLLHNEAKACAKSYPGCIDCDEDEQTGDTICLECGDDNASPDDLEGECVCNEDYGTITKAQVKDYKYDNKEAEETDNEKHNGLAFKGACVECSEYDLVAVAGVCEEAD